MSDRRSAQRRGRYAEMVARWFLRLKGYRILASGYRVPVGEIDILARRGSMLVAVEVKTRENAEDAAWSIGARQRRRIARATEYFLGSRPALRGSSVRFDAILVTPWRWPRHIRAAWME